MPVCVCVCVCVPVPVCVCVSLVPRALSCPVFFCVFVCACASDYAQALGNLKQKLRKYNKEFETSIEHYRQNPILSEEESQESGM